MVSAGFMKAIVITGMLLFGTCTVVIQKLIFNMKGTNKNGGEENFEKPWFQTEVMFIGMLGCLIVYEVKECLKKKKGAQNASETEPLVAESTIQSAAPEGKAPMAKWRQYLIVSLPAICDMIATSMMNIGLVWVPASVWQMLRGSMTIFSAFFTKFFLKRNLHASHWIGVCVVAFALAVVAFSALNAPTAEEPVETSTSSAASGFSTTQVGIGCALVVVAQIIQASQIVLEEFILKDININPVLVVGLEGLWGCICCALVLVVVSNVPPPYGEDGINTLYMLFHNTNILITGILYAVVILLYNLFGMYVTQYTSAVIRTILEGCRTACIWVTNLFIHYVVSKNFGETWNDWSYLQLCGFLMLLLGLFIYNGILRVQGLYYDDQAPKKEEEKAEAVVDEAK